MTTQPPLPGPGESEGHDAGRDDADPSAGQGPGPAPDRVVLYVRRGCHLCEAARAVLRDVTAGAGTGFLEVDVDAAPDSEDLVARYGELVPVVTVDGVQQGFWRVDAERVRRALSEPRPR